MPSDIQENLELAYHALDEGGPAVAVRSSATAEDLPGMSFAGQQDTYLNVSGHHALENAVRDCWASLWTTRAITYRERMRIDHQAVAMGIVVQTMALADLSGILFTANPTTGERSEMIINASYGLGEAVVSGQVTPDTYVVNRNPAPKFCQEICPVSGRRPVFYRRGVANSETYGSRAGPAVCRPGDHLKGFAVSPGKITAPASVILSPADFEKMKPGTILVCPTTTPAWTPLFAQAAGLVTEIGGILAHGSIVAREYGIPAVMGLTDITQEIQDGQLITLYTAKPRLTLLQKSVHTLLLVMGGPQRMIRAALKEHPFMQM